jgi:hypothetical protein
MVFVMRPKAFYQSQCSSHDGDVKSGGAGHSDLPEEMQTRAMTDRRLG